MTIENIMIPCGGINLEAEITIIDQDRFGILTHPHPLYGGSMHDFVLGIAEECLSKQGWSSLRFNFRGVGRSGGRYDNGGGEVDDLVAAANYLKESGVTRPLILGYSFGAWIAVKAWPRLKQLDARPLVLIAPPAGLMDFDSITPDTEIGLVVCGGQDRIADPAKIIDLGRKLSSPFQSVILPEADHFFGGCELELAESLEAYLSALETP